MATIIIVVVATILTAIIFGLAWLGYSACLKAYKMELQQGKHDYEIQYEYFNKHRHQNRTITVIWYVIGVIILLALISILVLGLVYKASGQTFSINGNSALVIKSNSMAGYYDDEIAEQGYDSGLQFKVGDICIFEKATDFKIGDVYGYLYKDKIITHRLVEIRDGFYIFRGDNNPSKDQILVPQENIIYHYTSKKVPTIGIAILYGQSFYGIWTLFCVIGISISSDIVLHKIHKMKKERAAEVNYEI